MSEVEPDYTHSCIDIIDLSVKQSRVMEKQKGSTGPWISRVWQRRYFFSAFVRISEWLYVLISHRGLSIRLVHLLLGERKEGKSGMKVMRVFLAQLPVSERLDSTDQRPFGIAPWDSRRRIVLKQNEELVVLRVVLKFLEILRNSSSRSLRSAQSQVGW